MLVSSFTRKLPFALVLACLHVVSAQEPVINGTVPGAVAPGTSLPLQINGGNLAAAKKLWLSFPAEAVLAEGIDKNGENPGQVTYRINVSPNTP